MPLSLPFQIILDKLASAVDSRKTIIKDIHLGKEKTVIICRRQVFKGKLDLYTPARNTHSQNQ